MEWHLWLLLALVCMSTAQDLNGDPKILSSMLRATDKLVTSRSGLVPTTTNATQLTSTTTTAQPIPQSEGE